MAKTTSRPFGTRRQAPSLAADLTECLRALANALFDPYRPELHYMRGRGPKWHAKHVAASGNAPGGAVHVLLRVRAQH